MVFYVLGLNGIHMAQGFLRMRQILENLLLGCCSILTSRDEPVFTGETTGDINPNTPIPSLKISTSHTRRNPQ
jgi:hypothetical protein